MIRVATTTDLAEFRSEVKTEMQELKWMVGVNMALTLGLIWQAMA